MAAERISTGIAGLDALIGGGYIVGRTYLFAGQAGTGKSIACLQFLVAALKRGERAVYVTVDERPGEILENAETFGWNLQRYIQERTFMILDASPYFGGRGAGAGDKGVDPQKVVADLGNYAKRLNATVLIIDPLTPLISPGDGAGAPDQTRSLIQLLQSQLNMTTLLTAHEGVGASDGDAGVEPFLASGVLQFGMTEGQGIIQRVMTIKKMRGSAAEPRTCRFVIRKSEGIVLAGEFGESACEPPMFELFDLTRRNS